MAAPKGNKFAVGNNGGSPPIYSDPKEVEEKCEQYFEYIKGEKDKDLQVVNPKTGVTQLIPVWIREPEPPTVTGLALFLGFCGRKTLDDYANKEMFGYIIKRAKLRVENGYERALYSQGNTGAIFALKNMGWKDKTETDITTGGEKIETRPRIEFVKK